MIWKAVCRFIFWNPRQMPFLFFQNRKTLRRVQKHGGGGDQLLGVRLQSARLCRRRHTSNARIIVKLDFGIKIVLPLWKTMNEVLFNNFILFWCIMKHHFIHWSKYIRQLIHEPWTFCIESIIYFQNSDLRSKYCNWNFELFLKFKIQ